MKFLITCFLLLFPTLVIADEVRVQVLIKEQTEVGDFTDALYYPITQWETIDPRDVALEREKRITNYVETVKTASQVVIPEPTEEEIQAKIQAKIDDLQNQLEAEQDKLDDIQ